MDREELREMLDDLQHDLGKHLLMPVALLPVGVSHDELRAAVARGLRQVAAWHAFRAEIGAHWQADPWLAEVEARLTTATAWGDSGSLERSRVEADFAAVGQAIRAWRRQVADD